MPDAAHVGEQHRNSSRQEGMGQGKPWRDQMIWKIIFPRNAEHINQLLNVLCPCCRPAQTHPWRGPAAEPIAGKSSWLSTPLAAASFATGTERAKTLFSTQTHSFQSRDYQWPQQHHYQGLFSAVDDVIN